jgi:hypothetical protein
MLVTSEGVILFNKTEKYNFKSSINDVLQMKRNIYLVSTLTKNTLDIYVIDRSFI